MYHKFCKYISTKFAVVGDKSIDELDKKLEIEKYEKNMQNVFYKIHSKNARMKYNKCIFKTCGGQY